MEYRVGTAGWAITAAEAEHFLAPGSHLERYGRRMTAVEINTSFYRPHKPATYARWAASVPAGFRFAVKVPREITHVRKLVGALEPIERFLCEVAGLEEKLGPLLVQLPPSLRFVPEVAAAFFDTLRSRFGGAVVCEPRHSTWFEPEASAVLTAAQIARVAADPPPVPEAGLPGGWRGLTYYRLHGSPKMYSSSYSADFIAHLSAGLRIAAAHGGPCWCIFDNTMHGAALGNALQLASALG